LTQLLRSRLKINASENTFLYKENSLKFDFKDMKISALCERLESEFYSRGGIEK
jgi:hypothetical protein